MHRTVNERSELKNLEGRFMRTPMDRAIVQQRRAVMNELEGNSEAYSFAVLEELEDNPLHGKTLCVLGSSVAYGFASGGFAVGEFLAARLGMKLIKEAVSGTTLADFEDNPCGKSYVERFDENIDSDAEVDLFLCQLSTNDATKNVPLGEVSAIEACKLAESTDTLDTTTVAGAMEYIIVTAIKRYGCPVAFFTGSRYESANYQAMYELLMKLKDKYGIIVLDLWSGEAFNNIPDSDYLIYMLDDIHPTKAGYRDWWGPELERQLLLQL